MSKLKVKRRLNYMRNWLSVKFKCWKPSIMNMNETMEYIINNKVSISRFGDGEFKWMLNIHEPGSFQTQDDKLRNELVKSINSGNDKLLVCVSPYFSSLKQYNEFAKYFWAATMVELRGKLKKIFPKKYIFGNLNITRFYMDYLDKSHIPNLLSKWKQVWGGEIF